MNKKDKSYFLEKAIKVHGNKYDYSKVVYNGCKEKVCIVCPEHGEFWQTPDNHFQGKGCPICRYISSSKKNTSTKEEFIKRAQKVHGDKYDYSEVNYVNNLTKVCIICPEHGKFYQSPTTHIDGKHGCPKCSKNYRYTTAEFIETLPDWIKEKYDFSKFEYKGTHVKTTLICPEHGEFLISPHNVRKGIGCPACSESKLEREIRTILKELGVEFISEYKHNESFHKQAIDFYIPKFKVGIECQGIQHYKPTDFAGRGNEWAEKEYEHIITLDINKQKLCKENDITLVYYTTNENIKNYNVDVSHFKGFKVFTNIDEIKVFISDMI